MECINNDIITIFFETKNALCSHSPFKLKKRCGDYLIKFKYKIWGKHIKNNKKEYNALIFNRVYFWKNFLKNLLFFDKHFFLINEKVLDVGCGAASASIAIACLVSYKNEKRINISLIDKSKRQLSIAQTFINVLSYKIESLQEGVFKFGKESYKELVVFSYFFCEQYQEFLKLLYDNRKKFTYGFVIIDYQENIELIKNYFYISGDKNIKVSYSSYSLPKVLKDIIHEKEVNVYGCYYQPQSKS